MTQKFEIVSVENPEWNVIGQAINDYNKQQAGDDKAKNICFVLRGENEEVVGGIIGTTYWDWFNISLMWVKEALRGQGYGHRLLTLAEQAARLQGARFALLDTFSFQAPDFYKQHGYEIFGELHDFPTGHQRFFMKKDIG